MLAIDKEEHQGSRISQIVLSWGSRNKTMPKHFPTQNTENVTKNTIKNKTILGRRFD